MTGTVLDGPLAGEVLAGLLAAGADYRVLQADDGLAGPATGTRRRPVHIELAAGADVAGLLQRLQQRAAGHSGTQAELAAAERDGVLPAGFYPATDLPTSVLLDGRWIGVELPRSASALVLGEDRRLRAVPPPRVRAGDRVVVGAEGVRVEVSVSLVTDGHDSVGDGDAPGSVQRDRVTPAMVAGRLLTTKQAGAKVLVACGHAVIGAGGGPPLARLVRAGWIDAVFAGNAFAARDLTGNVMAEPQPFGGTTAASRPPGGAAATSRPPGGVTAGPRWTAGRQRGANRTDQLRVINEIRRYGSIPAAVDSGYIDGGVLYECVRAGVPYVLAGSLGDIGPLPDVLTHLPQAVEAMRYLVGDVGLALLLATTAHALATVDVLPAWVETYRVDHAVSPPWPTTGGRRVPDIVGDAGSFLDELDAALPAQPPGP